MGPDALTKKDCSRFKLPAGNEAKPPNACNVIEEGSPYARIIRAWPSSWMRIERKPANTKISTFITSAELEALKPPPISAKLTQNQASTHTGIPSI